MPTPAPAPAPDPEEPTTPVTVRDAATDAKWRAMLRRGADGVLRLSTGCGLLPVHTKP